MKPAPFSYHRPDTLAEAVGTLAAFGDEAKVLAGGQSLVPVMALRLGRFGHIVDLGRVSALTYVRDGGGSVAVGAMTTHAAAGRDLLVAGSVPLLARAIPFIGHFQIRNRGTVGGSCAHADPAAEIPAVAVTLDAEMEAACPERTRRIPAAEFFASTYTTTLEPDEVLTALRFPVWPGRTGSAIREFARRSGDFALAGALCAVTLDAWWPDRTRGHRTARARLRTGARAPGGAGHYRSRSGGPRHDRDRAAGGGGHRSAG